MVPPACARSSRRISCSNSNSPSCAAGASGRRTSRDATGWYAGFWSVFLSPGRIRKAAIALQVLDALGVSSSAGPAQIQPAVFIVARCRKPGPKGPSEALIRAIVELKARNLRFGGPRIALIISQTIAIDNDKNVVYRVLAKCYRPAPGGTGPSWCRSLAIPPTVSGASTSFTASLSCFEATGCSR